MSNEELAEQIAKRGLASEAGGGEPPAYPFLDADPTELIEMGILWAAFVSRSEEHKWNMYSIIDRAVPLWGDGL